MSALDDLFEPIAKPTTKPVPGQPTMPDTGIVRRPDAITVNIQSSEARSVYVSAATEVMDDVAAAHSKSGKLVDVRQATGHPRGALDLAALTGRFHDGNEEMWVSRPQHMPADLMRFRGRFGYTKSLRMPTNHGSFGFIFWSWLDTNAGELPGIDLGLILVPIKDRWYRIFTNKSDAITYYQS